MAMDSMQKRMSAINPASPWRGPMVDATESGNTVGNRQAAEFMYSGIAAASGHVFRNSVLNGLGGTGQHSFNPSLAGM